jgi:hypothetical protein
MNRHYRIRVYGTQRKNIDPALLVQVVILFGRHLHQQQHTTEHTKTTNHSSASGNPSNPGVAHAEPPSRDTRQTPEGDEDGKGAVGEGLLP